jgi:ATP-dependent Clp protease ATP-binding subunit ClpA
MDHGTLTDNNGRKADFRHVILIMTTNAGAQEMNRGSMGFKIQDNLSDGLKAIEKRFTPEFRNRLDAIVQFAPLSKEAVYLIVEKLLTELQGKLSNKKVSLNVDSPARNWLVEHGYDRNMGARPMDRLVKNLLKKPLANEMLFGNLAQSGGLVKVTVNEDALKLDIIANESEPV